MLHKRIKDKIQLFKLWINNFLSPLKIVILIGSEASQVSAYFKNKLMETYFFNNNEKDHPVVIKTLNEFLDNYKKAKIYIILDNDEIILKHEELTKFESLLPKNVINDFVNQNFNLNYLHSYKIISHEYSQVEKIQVLFTSTPFTLSISFWLNKIFTQEDFTYGNIYFLPLEIHKIHYHFLKDYVDKEKQKELLKADIQIFLFITFTSGIRIIAEQNRNIIFNKTVKYPQHKSASYLQGTIEHELNEAFLHLKHLIDYDNDTLTNLTIIANDEVVKLIQNQKFSSNSQIILSSNGLIKQYFTSLNNIENTNFCDIILTDLALQHKTYPANNINLNKILNLKIFNLLCFKPLAIAIFILFINNCYFKYYSLKNEHEITNIGKEYFKYHSQYRDLKTLHSELQYVDQAIEVLLIQEKLSKPPINPFELINNFLLIDSQNVRIKDISWDRENNNQFNNKFLAEFQVKYYVNNKNKDNIFTEIEKYITSIRKTFTSYKISYSRAADKVKFKSDHIIVPLKITIIN